MALTKIRGYSQIQAGTILDAQIGASAAIATSKLADGANFLKRDGSVALTGNLDANSNKIINLAAPTSAGDAVNKSHLDTQLALYFKKDGSVSATGNFNLNSNKITNLGAPTLSSDAANKQYVDDLDAENLKKDGSVALTGDLDANGNRIINVGNPVAADDAVNKGYVDAVTQGLQLKGAVRAASTGNLTLANEQTVDAVALVAGDRVLVKDQTAAEDNGIYIVVDGGSWTRAADLDEPAELTAGIFTFVEEGTVNADSGWVLVTDNPIVLGTDAQSWAQFSGAGSFIAGAGLSKTGNQIDVNSANAAITVNANNIALTLADASLEISGSGLKAKTGTAGQVTVGDASGVPLPKTLSGDVSSVSAAGAVTLNAATIVKNANVVVREVPSGLINGVNVAFTLANTPLADSEEVFLNGLLLDSVGGNDYSISGGTITLVAAPESGDKLLVNYRK